MASFPQKGRAIPDTVHTTRFIVVTLAVAVLAGCGSDATRPTTGETTTAGPTLSGTTSPATDDTASPTTPATTTPEPTKERTAPEPTRVPRERGGSLWAVAIEISDKQDFNDPKLIKAADRHNGYLVGVNCDKGAREGLKLRPGKVYWYVTVYFATQDEAFAYKKKYAGDDVIGVVKVEPLTGQGVEDCVRRTPKSR